MDLSRLFAFLLAGTLLAGAAAPRPAGACVFHTDLPEKSLSQQIAGNVTLVAARPAPDDPFRFFVHRLLKGAPSSSAPPHLVDAATRRRLEAAPEHAVLFSRDGNGRWTRLLLLDETTGPIVARMLDQADRWATPGGAADRRDFATGLLAHPDPLPHRLALRELDALDYATLRRGTYPMTVADLLQRIADLQDQPYAPIRILLLGIVGEEAEGAEIARQLHRRAVAGIATDLGAWTTAALEVRGAGGIADMERALSARGRPPTADQIAEIVRALAVQSASGDPALRAPIRAALLRLVGRYPAAASLIPPALSAAADRHQTGLVRDLVAARAFSTRADLLSAAAYLSAALGHAQRPLAPPPAVDRFTSGAKSRSD